MDIQQAEEIMMNGIDKARRYLIIGCEAPKGSPLHNEMKEAVIEAMSWIHDDEVIDTLYEADMQEQEHDN